MQTFLIFKYKNVSASVSKEKDVTKTIIKEKEKEKLVKDTTKKIFSYCFQWLEFSHFSDNFLPSYANKLYLILFNIMEEYGLAF